MNLDNDDNSDAGSDAVATEPEDNSTVLHRYRLRANACVSTDMYTTVVFVGLSLQVLRCTDSVPESRACFATGLLFMGLRRQRDQNRSSIDHAE